MKKNIVWLASYPKSGNTWFRAFLYTLLTGAAADINRLSEICSNFAYKGFFRQMTDLSPDHFYDSEIKCLLPEVYTQYALNKADISYFKIHDAFTFNLLGEPIVPEQVTRGAIYLIRNPFDVSISLARHYNLSIDESIEMMNNHHYVIAEQKNNLNVKTQFQQLLRSWRLHVESWTRFPDFPVAVVRYEDLLAKPFETFSTTLRFLDLKFTEEQINQAIEASSFLKLKEQEQKNGFIEKPAEAEMFFSNGKKDKWKEILKNSQIQKILHENEELMRMYNYY